MRKRIQKGDISRGFTVVKAAVLRLLEFVGKEIRYYTHDVLQLAKKLWRGFHVGTRASVVMMLVVIVASIFSESLLYMTQVEAGSRVTKQAETLLIDRTPQLSSQLKYDVESGSFQFNEGYQTGSGALGTSSAARFSAVFPRQGNEAITVIDPVSSTSINIEPLFGLGDAERDQNRIIYDLKGEDGFKVITVASIGYKEDVILNSYRGDRYELKYKLTTPDGIEARLEQDGSIGFYGVASTLLGTNVTTGTPEDAALLESARENGEKNNLLYSMPAPYVVEFNRSESVVDTYFELDGDILTTKVSNLGEASYPLAIDPSVYVETARKFMRGNNETNVEFDVDNELIQKASTTGARFDEWASVQGLNNARFDGATTTAGGYIYQVGGVSGTVGVPEIVYDTAGSETFTVPAGITSITVKAWGGGGGGGGGSSNGDGGDGGGGAYATSVLTVTPGETLDIRIGGGGGGGTSPGSSGAGGGGAGHSEIERSGTSLLIAAGGGGGGGGDNSNGTPGGDGAPGGDETDGNDGGNSLSAQGGGGATTGAGGTAGTDGNTIGVAGSSETGGPGGNSGVSQGNGGENNGGINNGDGDGGSLVTDFYGAGGGGGSGLFGGGGGSGALAGNAGGGGGGSGVSFLSGASASASSGSGTTPGNSGDPERAGAGDGGTGNTGSGSGNDGDDGLVYITYAGGGGNVVESSVQWIDVNVSDGSLTSPNPGDGACTGWCTDSAYDLPDERRGHSIAAYNGFLYVIGGENDAGARQDTVYIAKLGANGEPSLWHPTDPDPDNWVYWYADTALSEEVSYSSAVAYNNRLYLIGGSTDLLPGGTTTVQYTDVEPTGTLAGWTSSGVLSLSTPRFQHSAEIYNDFIYVLGGDSDASGALLNTVEYVRVADDGTFSGSWESASSFSGARRSNGGDFATIYGAYLYIAGGCTSVSSGNCQAVGDEIQIASIFADGSLGEWSVMSNEQNDRVGFGMVAWQNNIYRIGGCTAIVTTSNECQVSLNGVDRGAVNPPGEVSTVNISEETGAGDCTGAAPQDCNLPDLGDGAGEGGGMLSATTILNGYLYVIGGCTDVDCNTSSGNVSYTSVSSDGSLSRPADCVANGNTLAQNTSGSATDGAWCVDDTRTVGTGTQGVSAPGVTTFNGRIYIIGGISESPNGSRSIYFNTPETDGSFSGTWTDIPFGTAGLTGELSYTYAYSRANPSFASTIPGNLFIFGGCTNFGAAAGCSGYTENVYKCNIAPAGAVSGCTTSGQLQIGTVLGSGSPGLAIHSGTVYANYIYLIGGVGATDDGAGIDTNGDGNFTNDHLDLNELRYARFDDNNNVVAVSGGEWVEVVDALNVGRRRGWAFGYNGHIYAVGGYDAGGGGVGGVLPFIEWSKIDVSSGESDDFVTSSVTINQRWGLSMAVSNSFAYVVGGCDDGASPNDCVTFEPKVQTFQLYNNDSGAPATYTESTGNFATDNDRIGSSAAILDGYIYVAGGENGGTIDANSSSVQFAPLNANGTIGAWQNDTATNFPNYAYGQLEAAGGSLYYIGGENNAGVEQDDVWFATPSSGTASDDVIRSTTYKFNSTEFSAANYTLTLNNDLESDYFVMITGSSDDSGGQNGAHYNQIRVDGDPFGGLPATTASDEIRLARGSATNNWVGSVTVVECISSCATDGFELTEVLDVSIANDDTLEDYSLGTTPSASEFSRTVPFGGYYGGGLTTTETSQNNFSATAGVRIKREGTNQIRVERQDNTLDPLAGDAAAADITIYVVEWGGNWSVQEVDFENWNAGNANTDDVADYTSTTITAVDPDNTWVWKSPGTSEDNGIGDGAFGKVLALGNGVTQTASEDEVSLGSRVSAADDVRDDTVYVMEHADLAVDHRFVPEFNATSTGVTVDAAIVSDSITNPTPNIAASEGYRVPTFYGTSNGTGTAYPRAANWARTYSNDTTITATRSYTGQASAAWAQSVDFGNGAGNPGTVDITTWTQVGAAFDLPQARTRHSAAVWNDRIYVTGGENASGNETDSVYISPPLSSGGAITGAWTTAAGADEFDVPRAGHTTIAYANNLYVLGGIDGNGSYLNDVQFTQINADGSLDPWTFTTSLPQYVEGADGFAANGFMYLVGGRSAVSTCTNNTYVAPISANTTIATGNNPTGVGEWYQTNVEFGGDRRDHAVAYNEGRVYVTGGGCASELTTDQHYVGSLRSQPQLARYSYFVDADTDVFPNAWLLNGLDNDIGARWQFAYRSSTDAANSWGVDTDFGDVTLGRVEEYVPRDASNVDSEFARYFYVTAEIDASQTFGYPDDVTRGPTIADLSIFFVSDPNKRLRHGKTFIQGVEQPLDTPCRISLEQPNCPLN